VTGTVSTSLHTRVDVTDDVIAATAAAAAAAAAIADLSAVTAAQLPITHRLNE